MKRVLVYMLLESSHFCTCGRACVCIVLFGSLAVNFIKCYCGMELDGTKLWKYMADGVKSSMFCECLY